MNTTQDHYFLVLSVNYFSELLILFIAAIENLTSTTTSCSHTIYSCNLELNKYHNKLHLS